MKITRIIWLRQYVVKIEAKHGIYPEEMRQILTGAPRIRLEEKANHMRANTCMSLTGKQIQGVI